MNEIIHKKYWHIDNGGFTFSVDKYGSLEIEFGFFGYATTKIILTPLLGKDSFNIDSLSEFFNEAKLKSLQHTRK